MQSRAAPPMRITIHDLHDLRPRFVARLHAPRANGCVEWAAWRDRDGYGIFQFRLHGKKFKIRAHRAAFMIENDIALSRDEVVRHACDNPLCCNPDHLEIGSHADNVADMVKRKRNARGTRHGRAKLTQVQAEQIRRLAVEPKANKTHIACRFGVTPKIVRMIVRGEIWA